MKQHTTIRIGTFFIICSMLAMSGCIPPGGRGRTAARIPPPPPPPGTTAAPAEKGPPPWAPAHGHREKRMYRYRYYPATQVYFDTDRSVYFYMERGGWTMAPALPPFIHLDARDFFLLEDENDRPYLHHHETVKKYPPGQMKKRHKEKEKRGKGHGNNKDW